MYPVPRSDTAAAPHGDRPADAGPVFLDRSGRRQRRVRRLGWLLVVPAAGYAVLLLSAVLGGPTVSGTYVPLPEGGHRAPAHPGTATSGTQPRHPRSAPTGGATTAPRTASATAAPPKASASSTAAPSTSPTAAAKPLPTPTASHGNSQVTHPVPTHTGRGRG